MKGTPGNPGVPVFLRVLPAAYFSAALIFSRSSLV